MTVEQNKQVVLDITEAFNTGETYAVDEHMDRRSVDLTPFPETARNRDGLKRQIESLRTAFPDALYTVEDVVAEGDKVAFRWKMVGTHRGPLFGHEGTGKSISHSGIDILTFNKEGKIIEHRSSDNLPGLLSKLGLPVNVPFLERGHEER
jgi:predicted ester cyclase